MSCPPEPSAYAAAISAISERQRVKSRRRSDSTWPSPLRRTRRLWGTNTRIGVID